MIQQAKIKKHMLKDHTDSSELKLCVCVRKRPLFAKEAKSGEIDVVSCANPRIVVHEPKIKVDGITKYIQD
jgi:kinesin family protein 2/24